MSSIKLEESLDNVSATDALERIEQMKWKSVDLKGIPAIVPNLSKEFEKEMEEKARNIRVKKELTQNNEQIAVNQQSNKTKYHIKLEKAIKRANSIYGIIRSVPRNRNGVNPKPFVLVAERYPIEDFVGLSEADLIGKEEKRKMEGELTTEEIRRWRRLNRGDAVYSLESGNYEHLKKRFERGRQGQNPNFEEIRRPIRGNGGSMHDNRSRRSASPHSSSFRSRDPSNQDVRDERRRERNSRSRSRSPR